MATRRGDATRTFRRRRPRVSTLPNRSKDGRARRYDAKVFALALLLSSYFVLNVVGVIDDATVERLHLVTEVTKRIVVEGAAAAPDDDDDADDEGRCPARESAAPSRCQGRYIQDVETGPTERFFVTSAQAAAPRTSRSTFRLCWFSSATLR